MNISKYIAELLFDFECVVIPGLGGFIVSDKPSSINRINHQFKPPFRNILFNTHLKANDGLLVNQIATSEGLSFKEAKSKVDSVVLSIVEKLKKGESYTFVNIGTIHFDSEKNIVFNQYLKFNYNPDSFGLSGFVSPPVKRVSDEEKLRNLIIPPKAKTSKPIDRKPELIEETTKKKRKTWPILLVLGVLILLFSVGWGILNPEDVKVYWKSTTSTIAILSPGLNRSNNQNVINEARYTPRRVVESDKGILAEIDRNKKSEIQKAPTEALVDAEIPTDGESVLENKTEIVVAEEKPIEFADEPDKEVRIDPPKVQPTGKLYYIIAGSFSNEKNAHRLVNDLKLKGFDAQIADTNANGMFRVAYIGIKNLHEAKEKLYAIREEDNPDAWIFRN